MPIDVLPEDVPVRPPGDGLPPTDKPLILNLLMGRWFEQWQAQPPRPMAVEGTTFRASWAGKCAREISYLIQGVEPSNPPDLPGAWAMSLGSWVHDDVIGPLVKEVFGDTADTEVNIDFRPSFDGSAHADMVIVLTIQTEDAKVLVELKTTNGFQYKKQVLGWDRKPPQGPKMNAYIQGALSAHAVDADYLVIGVISLEAISPAMARQRGIGRDDLRRIASEWWFSRDEFGPVAEREQRRIANIMAAMADGKRIARAIPLPELPAGARVVNPKTGLWRATDDEGKIIASDTTWYCDYCDFQDHCSKED